MVHTAIAEPACHDFVAHFSAVGRGPGGLRRERVFVRLCLSGAVAAARKMPPSSTSLTWKGEIALGNVATQSRRIPAVVTGSPVEIEGRFNALDEMEFHHEGDAIIGTLAGDPALVIWVGDQVEIRPADPVFG